MIHGPKPLSAAAARKAKDKGQDGEGDGGSESDSTPRKGKPKKETPPPSPKKANATAKPDAKPKAKAKGKAKANLAVGARSGAGYLATGMLYAAVVASSVVRGDSYLFTTPTALMAPQVRFNPLVDDAVDGSKSVTWDSTFDEIAARHELRPVHSMHLKDRSKFVPVQVNKKYRRQQRLNVLELEAMAQDDAWELHRKLYGLRDEDREAFFPTCCTFLYAQKCHPQELYS